MPWYAAIIAPTSRSICCRSRTPELIAVDWGAFPARPTACLQSTSRANRLLDWTTLQGAIGRAEFQDEYVEWRTVRDADGKIRRVEMTTELPEYWLTLAAYHPVKTLQLVARFAGEASVSPQAVYGGVNPFKRGITPQERRAAFEDAMLPRGGKAPWSPYNNGEKALCFMCQGANTLGGLIALASKASLPYGAKDPDTGELRKLSGPEAIATRTQAADACRNSDPTVVGGLIGLAWDGRLFALDDPTGIYIRSVQYDRLLQPDGSPVPPEWFELQRGSRPRGTDQLERSQRLVFEVPPGVDFSVGDLIDSQTGQPIEYGGQIADLVQLVAYLRVSAPKVVPVNPRELPMPTMIPCEQERFCQFVNKRWEEFEASQRNLLANTPTGIASRDGGLIA
jgi:hypothetical protein